MDSSSFVAVPKDLTAEEESALFRMLQAVAVPLIGNACHVFMNGLNRVQVLFHKDTFFSFRRVISVLIFGLTFLGVWFREVA